MEKVILRLRRKNYFFELLLIISCLPTLTFAQQTLISGTVKDAENGEELPFVNLQLQGTTVGTTTDVDGFYRIVTSQAADTLIVSFIGYITQKIKIIAGQEQTLNITLTPETRNLEEVVFTAPENPAYAIMRQVVKNKKVHNERSIRSYALENYTKIEFDVDQISEKLQQSNLVQKVQKAIDTIDVFRNKGGEPLIPIFVSETISNLYVQNEPVHKQSEEILKANITGIGIKNKKTVAQLTGVSFQQYNFYDNWLNIITRDFVSPIADGWKTFYEYYLTDSAYVGEHYCYKLEFEPKVQGDLAFRGFMWITKDAYALKQIDAEIGAEANLNFIESIHIYQELSPTSASAWLTTKTEFEIVVSELTPNFTGVRAKFYVATRDWTLNQPLPDSYFILPIEVSEEINQESSEKFWEDIRPEPLESSEQSAIAAINTIKDITSVKIVAETIRTLRRGYVRTGDIDWGPYLMLYAYNNIEGNRFRLGFRTNDQMSNKWVFSGYLAYGTRDSRWKYGAGVERILSRKPWTTLSFNSRYDIEQLGVLEEGVRTNFIYPAASRFGTLRQPHLLRQNTIRFQTDLFRDFTQSVAFTNKKFDPLFPFAYYKGNPEAGEPLKEQYTTTELVLESRWAKDEKYIFDNNVRANLGTMKAPIFTFRYHWGIDNFLHSSFGFHKFILRMDHRLNVGLLGTSVYAMEGGYIPSQIPYPSLKNHVGNTTIFHTLEAFNLMEFGEFVSDKYVFLKYNHHFEGFILNRIPLMKRLKWRLVASANILYGSLSDKNRKIIPEEDIQGNPISSIKSLEEKPYVEVGYGIENIFKVFSVQAFHRLTYLDDPGTNPFGVKVNISLKP